MWGDLRYDHSDIFGPSAKVHERISGTGRGFVGPGHPYWTRLLELAARPEGVTVAEFAAEIKAKSTTGSTARVFARMMDAGELTREKRVKGTKGQQGFVYRLNPGKKREG